MDQTNLAVSPCFTPGTAIATDRGERRVEDLREGDKVVTRDNGLQPIAWVGQRTLSWRELHAAPHLLPIVLRAGSLWDGNRPERDLYVSPDHRIVVDARAVMRDAGKGEVLAAAKELIDHKVVKRVEPLRVCYLHLLFARHQVILSNGLWTESFCPSDPVFGALGHSQKMEILSVFPDLADLEVAARPARPALHIGRARER